VGLGLLVASSVGGCNSTANPSGDAAAGKALVANLRGGGDAQAEVEFRVEGDQTQFSLAIHGGQPGATVDVTVNGVVVLSVTLDDFGNARLDFSSQPNALGEDQLPASFPDANGGDLVGVGEWSGRFEDNADADSEQHADRDDDEANDGQQGGGLELGAELSASDSSLRAKVRFESEADDSDLSVRVRGGEPGSTLDFAVDGVVLGTLTLDQYGFAKLEFDAHVDEGELPFPADFVAPVEGTPFTVGPLSGTFTAESNEDGQDDADNHEGDDDGADDNANDNVDDNSNTNDNVDNTNDNGSGGGTVSLDGAALYGTHCAVCHGADGAGGPLGPSVVGESENDIIEALSGVTLMQSIQVSGDEIAAIAEFLAN